MATNRFDISGNVISPTIRQVTFNIKEFNTDHKIGSNVQFTGNGLQIFTQLDGIDSEDSYTANLSIEEDGNVVKFYHSKSDTDGELQYTINQKWNMRDGKPVLLEMEDSREPGKKTITNPEGLEKLFAAQSIKHVNLMRKFIKQSGVMLQQNGTIVSPENFDYTALRDVNIGNKKFISPERTAFIQEMYTQEEMTLAKVYESFYRHEAHKETLPLRLKRPVTG